jgi:hypothetical protein
VSTPTSPDEAVTVIAARIEKVRSLGFDGLDLAVPAVALDALVAEVRRLRAAQSELDKLRVKYRARFTEYHEMRRRAEAAEADRDALRAAIQAVTERCTEWASRAPEDDWGDGGIDDAVLADAGRSILGLPAAAVEGTETP